MSLIKAIQKCFPHCNIHGCFFHFSQSVWRNFKKYGLGGKGTYSRNHELLLNLQTLCFIEKEKIDKLYGQIKKKYKADKYKKFFNYFTRNWMGNKMPKVLWNYHDLLVNPNNVSIFHVTNNITENINRYLNSKLKKAICSNFLFRECILDIIVQFKIKTTENSNLDKKKSEILDFYIKRVGNNDDNLITNEDYDKILILYEELSFPNINKKYSEDSDGEVDILYDDEDE